MQPLAAFLITLLPLLSSGLYTASDGVVLLDQSNWKSQVMDADGVVIVEFFAPWCGHCKALAPEWVKAAQALSGFAKVAAVDMDQHQALGAPYGVKGFPTIKIFGADKTKPKDYQQAREAGAIAQAVIQEVASIVQSRLGGSGSNGPSEVITLTDENFEKQVLQSEDLWLVEFYAPWCGHCQKLAPEWNAAAADLKGKVKLGALDATAEKQMASKYGVQGFPTIKYFGADKQSPEDYNGGRSKSDLVTFGLDKVEASLPPPEVHQLVSQQVWDTHCSSKSICLVGFLPGLVDSGAEGRNKYIEIMKGLTEKQTLKKFGFLWTSVGLQPELEGGFNVGDYPALVAVNPKKQKFAQMRGSFSSEELSGFIGRLMSAREATAPFEMPKLMTHDPWDGKDEVIAADEEEMSLDDIMNESLED